MAVAKELVVSASHHIAPNDVDELVPIISVMFCKKNQKKIDKIFIN